jgi:hypothetical protein
VVLLSPQIDINPWSAKGREFITSSLKSICESGKVTMLRIDAFGYTTKKPGSSCFFLVSGRGAGFSRKMNLFRGLGFSRNETLSEVGVPLGRIGTSKLEGWVSAEMSFMQR